MTDPLVHAAFAATYVTALGWAGLIVSLLIAVSAADDLFIDACFWGRELWRLFMRRRFTALSEETLRSADEQPIAIMVPAWSEAGVIAAMLENAIRTLDYDRYNIFVGTYPNDPDTIEEVDRVAKRHPRVRRVTTSRDGPTCKADCLNAILGAILEDEAENGYVYAGVVMHDSEDVLHPLELQFFNYLLPRKDMIQLPVSSLERGNFDWIAASYMDEFAEAHGKDLVVREMLGGGVPSAGVGTCFSRRAIGALHRDSAGEPFNTATLTEDYDIAARLRAHGLRSILARYPVTYEVPRRTLFGLGATKIVQLSAPLCVREYFPNTFRAAYRQKARWILGIALQGWAQIGWTRSVRANYFLARDRKSLITPALSLASYFLLANIVILWTLHVSLRAAIPQVWIAGPLLAFNAFAMIARTVQRLFFVGRLFGWEHALMSLPRMLLGTFINLAATFRALRLYAGHLLFGTPLTWDKTAHVFPTGEALHQKPRRLGEILVEWGAIPAEQVDAALERQMQDAKPLGHVLMREGWLDEETLAEAISVQSGLPRERLNSAATGPAASILPSEVCLRLRVLPLRRSPTGEAIIATARPLPAQVCAQIGNLAGGGLPVLKIVREDELLTGLAQLDTAQAGAMRVPTLKRLLDVEPVVEEARYAAALDRYRPERDGRFGELLFRMGIITREAVKAAAARQTELLERAH